jgi:hypothetical protein
MRQIAIVANGPMGVFNVEMNISTPWPSEFVPMVCRPRLGEGRRCFENISKYQRRTIGSLATYG